MDLLKRKLAPILPDAWKLVDAEAARVLRLHLAGRKVVDFRGPFGWKYAAVNTGRLAILDSGVAPEVAMGVREVQPVIELRVPILLSTMELDIVARGGEDPDLAAVVRAAEKIAFVEDTAIFNGLPRAAIKGILESAPRTIPLPQNVNDLPAAILAAKELLRRDGVTGPYGLLLGSALYDQVLAATEDGYPLAKRIEQKLIDHPIIRASAIEGGALISLRGGDYELTVGQDLSVGYAYHSRDQIELYVTESFTFRVLEPTATVRIAARASVSVRTTTASAPRPGRRRA